MTTTPVLSSLLTLLILPTLSAAYSWNFKSTPQQCSNLTIEISGQGGRPPYRVLILPFGPTPLGGNIEARRIVDQLFHEDDTSVSFRLNYPADSQFVAVVSDASGFGSGGTSVAAQVTSSSDSSCFDHNTNVAPQFVFSIEPANQIVQCKDTRLWWVKENVQGTPNFLGVIPGGQSFAIPQGPITDIIQQGTGFTWKPSIKGGTTLIIVGGDNRGNGTAGSSLNTVANGPDNDGSCLNNASPSSTPGTPAGGSYPTGTGSTSPSGGGKGSGGTNTGAIVGGVVGGVAFVSAILIALFFLRRHSRQSKHVKERPLDLDGDEGDDAPATHGGRTELPDYYRPEPFMVPDPTSRSSFDGHTMTGGATSSEERPLSGHTSTSRSGTPDLLGSVYGYGVGAAASSTTSGRKGAPRAMRPVNVIQHDDAGPTPGQEQEPGEAETVELPPAYTNIRK